VHTAYVPRPVSLKTFSLLQPAASSSNFSIYTVVEAVPRDLVAGHHEALLVVASALLLPDQALDFERLVGCSSLV